MTHFSEWLFYVADRLIATNYGRRIGIVDVSDKSRPGDTTTIAFGRGAEWSKKVRELFQTWFATEVSNAICIPEHELHIRALPQLEALVNSLTEQQSYDLIKMIMEHLCLDQNTSPELVQLMQRLSLSERPRASKKNDKESHLLEDQDNSSTQPLPESE